MEHSNAYHPANFSGPPSYTASPPPPPPAQAGSHAYMQEIEALRQELQRKEHELQKLRNAPVPEYYTQVNKDLFDRHQTDQRRQETMTALDAQLNHRQQLHFMETRQRETEQARRLEDLHRLRDEEMRAQAERLQRARALNKI